jgi:hypothetical protein
MRNELRSYGEQFSGQKFLAGVLLLVLAVAMVAQGVRELANSGSISPDLADAAANSLRIQISAQNYEAALNPTSLDEQGLPAGWGWLKTGPRPGTPGVAVIVIDSLNSLKSGDRIKISQNDGSWLDFEITRLEGFASLNAALNQSEAGSSGQKWLKLVNHSANSNGQWLAATARLLTQ